MAEVYEFGPVHAYVTPVSVGAESKTVLPVQPGPLLLAKGALQVVAVIGDEVVPGIGQPNASKMPGLLPLL